MKIWDEQVWSGTLLLTNCWTFQTLLCVFCVWLGMSLWWQACPGRFLAMLWRHAINTALVCLVLCLHCLASKPDILSVLRISFWLKSSTCAAVVTSSPHQDLTYSGQISRWGWVDGEREQAGRMICLASCRVIKSHHNHREFSECVLWVLAKL